MSDEITDSISNEDEKSQHSSEEPPLMQLFNRLINSHGDKQNTVLTNSQLIDILKEEFELNIVNLHILEVDIYMNVIKKFLKDWPQWDEFDEIINSHSCVKEIKKSQQKQLEDKYLSLKEYLRKILDRSSPLAKETVDKVIKENEEKPTFLLTKKDNTDNNDIVMEIKCNRRQLNNLILRCPNSEFNNTIFNVGKYESSKINLNTIDFKTILNWPTVSFSINLPYFRYKRNLCVNLEHRLINKNLKDSLASCKPLDNSLEKNTSRNKILHRIGMDQVVKTINRMENKLITDFPERFVMVRTIFDVIKADFSILPNTFQVPGSFRKVLNKYQYIRYLSQNVSNATSNMYDLRLEETNTPMLYVDVLKVFEASKLKRNIKNLSNHNWLQIKCGLCHCIFSVGDTIREIANHFNDLHLSDEIDWQCTHCKQVFTVPHLSSNMWSHEC